MNDNNGTVVLLIPSRPVGDPGRSIVIASGGTRGDFVSPDTSNGTLFLSQNEQVARLSCGPVLDRQRRSRSSGTDNTCDDERRDDRSSLLKRAASRV